MTSSKSALRRQQGNGGERGANVAQRAIGRFERHVRLGAQLLDAAEQVVHARQPFATRAGISLLSLGVPSRNSRVGLGKSAGGLVVGRARGRQVGPLPSREGEALSRSGEVIEDGGGGGFVRQLAQARRPASHLERRRGLGGFSSSDSLEASTFCRLGLLVTFALGGGKSIRLVLLDVVGGSLPGLRR